MTCHTHKHAFLDSKQNLLCMCDFLLFFTYILNNYTTFILNYIFFDQIHKILKYFQIHIFSFLGYMYSTIGSSNSITTFIMKFIKIHINKRCFHHQWIIIHRYKFCGKSSTKLQQHHNKRLLNDRDIYIMSYFFIKYLWMLPISVTSMFSYTNLFCPVLFCYWL